MFQQPFGMPAHDPAAAQISHETLNVIQDIESRLLALKIGIAQTNPALAPVLLWREQAIAALSGRVPMVSPTLAPIGAISPGINPQAVVATQAALSNLESLYGRIPSVVPGISPYVSSPVSPFFGVPLSVQSGVVHPFGIATPFRY